MAKNKNEGKWKGTLRHVLWVSLGTFFLGIGMSSVTSATVERVEHIAVAFAVLLLIIFINVIFDGVGVAVAVADSAPFNARAARRAPGARKSLNLIKQASFVANFCCDVVGDVCGIISGAVAATISLLLIGYFAANMIMVSAIMAGLVSALTVGGKAIMKDIAIREANKIMELVGLLLDYRNWPKLFSGKVED